MPKIQHLRPIRQTSRAPQPAKLTEAAPARAATLRHLAPGAIVQRAMAARHSLRPAELMAMQQTLGNRAVGAMLGRQPIQGKLIVNAPGDKYEREADRIAEQVTRMPAPPRAELEDEEKRQIIAQPAVPRSGNGAFATGEGFEQQLDASRGRGQPLPSALQTEFEAKFGADFSGVTVHADAHADGLSRSIQAEAFTRGRDIYVAGSQFVPDSMEGKRLLAHELTHVVQQTRQWNSKDRRDQDHPVISRLDNAVTIQRKLDTSKYKKIRKNSLTKAIDKYDVSQRLKEKVKNNPREYDAAQMVELEALQWIEVLANEWLAKHGTLKTGSEAKLISQLMEEVMGEIDRPDIQQTERRQYRQRTEDTQVSRGNQGFFGNEKREPKPFKYVTEEGLKATNPFDYDKAKEAANKAEKEAKELKQAAEKEKTDKSKTTAEDAKDTAEAAIKKAAKEEQRNRNVKQYADKYLLGPEELFAIRLYTAGDYKYINPVLVNDPEMLERHLKAVGDKGATGVETTWAFEDAKIARGKKAEAPRRDLRMEAMQHSRRALAGLSKLPDAPRTDTFRGLAMTLEQLKEYTEGKKAPGWSGFSSTSTNRDLAEYYARKRANEQKDSLAVLMISTVTQGKDVNPISLYPNESEILVLPGAKFTVTQNDLTEKNGLYELRLVQTGSGQKQPAEPTVAQQPRGINPPPLPEIPRSNSVPTWGQDDVEEYNWPIQLLELELRAEQILLELEVEAAEIPQFLKPAAPAPAPSAETWPPPSAETKPRLRPQLQPWKPVQKSVQIPGDDREVKKALPYRYWTQEALDEKRIELLGLLGFGNEEEVQSVTAELIEVSRELLRRLDES